jgi:hypothetical protein
VFSIDDIPLLRNLVLSILHMNGSAFLINISLYPHDLVVSNVCKVCTSHFKHLPPSGVGSLNS